MKTKRAQILLATLLTVVVFTPCEADDQGYWSIRLPVPESASNPVEETNADFLTRRVSFDWRGKDTGAVRDFYSRFFTSIGWADPVAESPAFSGLEPGGWSSYNMRFDEYDKPVAAYAQMWKARDYPAFGTVMVTLDGLEGEELLGSVAVQIAPEVDTQAMFRLTGLIGNDPKNLFKLHNAVRGNPFELDTIALPANYEDETDPLLAEYYQIVEEIRAAYEAWRQEYISP